MNKYILRKSLLFLCNLQNIPLLHLYHKKIKHLYNLCSSKWTFILKNKYQNDVEIYAGILARKASK